jgi:Xaa-Pro aminopeptidase
MEELVPRTEYEQRHRRTREALDAEGLDAVIAYSTAKVGANVRYLSGYFVRFAGMQNRPDGGYHMFGSSVCLFDAGDRASAVRTDQPWDVVRAEEVSIFDDTGYSGLFADDLGPLCRERRYRRVGIDNWYLFPAREYLALQAHAPDTEFVATHVLSQVRRQKSPWEIDVLRRSALAAVNGVQSGFSQVGVGAMEYDIVMHAEWGMREMGELELGGQSIAGCGLRTATGSSVPSSSPAMNNPMRKGEWYMLDICPRVDGYAGDISRHKVAGTLSDLDPTLQRAYDTTLLISEEVRKAVKPGVTGRELSDLAQAIAEQDGFGDERIDLLGHGIGLDIHDIPDYYWDDSPLQPGEVVTVEPCLLVPGLGGVRIEDMVLVTAEGNEVLTDLTRELTAEA